VQQEHCTTSAAPPRGRREFLIQLRVTLSTSFSDYGPAHVCERTFLMAGAVTTLSDATFDETIGASDAPVLVDFWAEWCGPCKMIAPILEEIAEEQGDAVTIAKLNVDEAGDIARRFEVMSIPTLILFQNGEPVKRIVGAKPKQALLDDIAEYI